MSSDETSQERLPLPHAVIIPTTDKIVTVNTKRHGKDEVNPPDDQRAVFFTTPDWLKNLMKNAAELEKIIARRNSLREDSFRFITNTDPVYKERCITATLHYVKKQKVIAYIDLHNDVVDQASPMFLCRSYGPAFAVRYFKEILGAVTEVVDPSCDGVHIHDAAADDQQNDNAVETTNSLKRKRDSDPITTHGLYGKKTMKSHVFTYMTNKKNQSNQTDSKSTRGHTATLGLSLGNVCDFFDTEQRDAVRLKEAAKTAFDRAKNEKKMDMDCEIPELEKTGVIAHVVRPCLNRYFTTDGSVIRLDREGLQEVLDRFISSGGSAETDVSWNDEETDKLVEFLANITYPGISKNNRHTVLAVLQFALTRTVPICHERLKEFVYSITTREDDSKRRWVDRTDAALSSDVRLVKKITEEEKNECFKAFDEYASSLYGFDVTDLAGLSLFSTKSK